MAAKLAKTRVSTKSAPRTIRNRKSTIRNQTSSIVLKLRDILQAETRGRKAAYALVPLIERPLSSCQKILDDKLPLNAEALIALIRSDLGGELLDALMGEGPHPDWYAEQREDLKVFALSKEVAAQQRRVDEVLKRRLGQ